MDKSKKHGRPPMKMSSVQPHQMPAPEHDGVPPAPMPGPTPMMPPAMAGSPMPQGPM